MRAPARRIALIIAPLLTSAANLFAQDLSSAQDSPGTRRSEWLVGISLGVPGHEDEFIPELLTMGVHWTQLRAGRMGADFSLGTVPRALGEGVLVLGARGGIALPLAVSPGILLLPSAGVSILGGVGVAGAGGIVGLNAGVAAVLLQTDAAGLRTGVTWHRFGETGEALWLVEVGLVRGPRER